MRASTGTVSDINGYFELETPEGAREYKVVVSYVGYFADTFTVPATQKGIAVLKLQPKAEQLKAVTVTGRFEGQQLALFQQRNAANIKNVVSFEQIRLFPDVNAAEAIQRIPGITLQRDQGEGRYVQLRGTPPALTNFNINGEQVPSPEGDVRYVGLDVIAADQIASIEITKALTPDMDADGIGGNVNIITKTAKDSVPNVNFSLIGGYNNISSNSNYQGNLSYGLKRNKFGFHVNGNYYKNNQGADNMEFRYVKRNTQEDSVFQPIYDDIQLRHYTVSRERIGLSSTLDYDFSKTSRIYIKAMYNRFTDQETRRRTRYKFGSGAIINKYRTLEATVERDMRDRTKIQSLNTVNIGGEHKVKSIKIDYLVAYSKAVESEPDRIEMAFVSPDLNMELDLSESNWPRVTFPSERDQNNYSILEDYDFEEMLISNAYTQDENLATKFNIQIPYSNKPWSKGFLKFGTRIRYKEKYRDNKATVYDKYYKTFLPGTRQIYLQEGPDLSLETVYSGFEDKEMLNRGYVLGAHPDPELARDFYEFYGQNFKIAENDTKEESFSEDYTAFENIYAFYGMFKHTYKRWMVLGGVRYEQTDVNYSGFDFQTYKGRFFRGIEELKSEKTYQFVLPQFHVRYRPNPLTNIRFAATYTYSRPNFEDILPYRQEDIDDVTFGNPDLEFPVSFNLDLLAEKYLPKNGLIAGGLFYKRIDNFIFYYKRFVHLDSNFSTAGLKEVTMANNGIQAYVYGAEITANYKFSFLPGILGNFGVYTNYTYTYSEAEIFKRTELENLGEVFIYNPGGGNEFVRDNDERELIPMPGQAQHALNFAVFYDTKKLYLKLVMNYQSAFLDELGQEPDFDEYYGRSFHLDATADYRMNKNWRIFAQGINLTNAPLTYYLGSEEYIKQQEYYSWSARLGLRYSF